MYAPRKHHIINTSAPNHLLQPLLAENQHAGPSNPRGTTGEASAPLLPAAEAVSLNPAFAFTASFPACLLKPPITSQFSCDRTAKLFKEASKTQLLQLVVCTPIDPLRFSLVKLNTTYSRQVCQETHGSAIDRKGGRRNRGRFLSTEYHNTPL